MTDMNPQEFRTALGQFATGVTIVTTLDADSSPVGVTASSFNSVSLDPPLVLWSLAKSAQSLDAFKEFGHFAVHVLASDQQDLSNRFARAGTDKFADVDFHSSDNGLPLFDNCAARFVCRTFSQYEGGDHIILVGEVVEFAGSDRAPLLFHGGSYKDARDLTNSEQPVGDVDMDSGTFSSDFFSYLVTRAHFQFSSPAQKEREQVQMWEDEYHCLILLSLAHNLNLAELHRRSEHTGIVPNEDTIERLIKKGWVAEVPGSEPQQYSQTDSGRKLFIDLLAKYKAREESILTHFSAQEVADMRGFMQRLVAINDLGVPDIWE